MIRLTFLLQSDLASTGGGLVLVSQAKSMTELVKHDAFLKITDIVGILYTGEVHRGTEGVGLQDVSSNQ